MNFLPRLKRKTRIITRLFFLVIAFSSFSKQHKASYLDDAPFRGKAYQNNKRYYRCAGTGKSTDITVAHDKALLDAKKRLTEAIVNSFDDNIGSDSDRLKQFVLKDVKIVDEKVIVGSGHTNICWLIIKARKWDVRRDIEKGYYSNNNNEKSRRLFLKEFNREMKSQKNLDY